MDIFTGQIRQARILSRIDARVKLVIAIALLLMVVSSRGFLFPAMIGSACLAACVGLKVPVRTVLLRFSEPLFIAAVLIVLKFFFSGSEPLFTASFFNIVVTGYRDGLQEGLMIAGRILGAVSIVALVGFSTPFTEIMAALSWLRVPRSFIEILMFAYRYIFVLVDEAAVIYSAQKNRLGYSNFRRGLNSFGVLAGSLTLKAFDHSQNTTVAMTQRGYDGNIPLLTQKAFKLSEVAASACFITAMGMLWKM